MAENGYPYKNALAERVNSILKSEWLDDEHYDNFEQANDRICRIIKIDNTLRPYLICDMLTPKQAYAKAGKLKKNGKKEKDLKEAV